MRFKLTIDMNGAAFDGDYRPELRRILTERVLVQLREWSPGSLESDAVPLRDINGNRVGEFSIDGE